MEIVPTLMTSAEISAGLLGFAAIVSVFRGDLTAWLPEGRFWVMLVMAASSFSLALLPLPLIAHGGAGNLVWSVPAFGLVLAGVGVVRISLWGQRIQTRLGIQTHVPTLITFLILLGMTILMGILNLGLQGEPAFWRHLTGLIAFQLATVLFFVRLLRLWLVKGENEDGQ